MLKIIDPKKLWIPGFLMTCGYGCLPERFRRSIAPRTKRGETSISTFEQAYPISISTLCLVFSSPRICWISQISGDWLRPATARRMTVLT